VRRLLTAAVVAFAALPARADEPLARSSEELLPAAQAWASPGFRLSLSFGYELLVSLNVAPGARSVAPALQIGWRISPDLSLAASLRYSAAHAGLGGLRASATIEPVWHVTDELELSAGAGYVASLLDNPVPATIPLGVIEDAVRAGRDPDLPVFGECDGHGINALLRAAWLWRVGPLFSTGPMVQLDAQWVSCSDDDFVVRSYDDITNIDDPGLMFTDGPTVTMHQAWSHFTVSAAWVFAWR